MWNPFKNKEIKKESWEITGQPYTNQQWASILAPYRQAIPYARDPWTWKASTVRTITELDTIRQLGRWLTETNPYAHGLLSGLRCFVIGAGFTIKVISKDSEQKRLVKQTQELLDAFAEDNELGDWYQEKFWRDHRDGETFLQLFNDEIIQLRAIEPDSIRVPVGADTESNWSMGIKHKQNDYQTAEAYCVQYFDGSQKQFSAEQILHQKLNVVRNVKRGISSFYPCYENLKSTHKLLWTWQEGDKARSSIAYAIQTKSDKSTIQSLQAGQISGSYTQYGFDQTEKEIDVETIVPGRVAYIPEGMQFVPPPQGAEESAAIRAGLQAVAARYNVPQWLVSGESGESSYASATLPESLMLRRCDHEQERQIHFWRKLLRQVIKMEINRGQLPENTLDLVEVELIPPSPVNRDRENEIKCDMQLVKSKLMSQHTFCSKYNLDYDQEQQQIEEEPELEINDANDTNNPETSNGQLQKETPKA